ncbi:MAG: YybH family protein [Thermoanaerobaculia bacterium]
MKNGAAFVILLVLGAFPALAQPKPHTLDDVRRAIDAGNKQWSDGWLKRDASMVAAIFAPDGVQLTMSGKVIKGPADIRERQRVAMESVDPGVKVTVTTTNVWLDGDTAYETGTYKYEYVEKGKPSVDTGRYVTTWQYQKDGTWKLTMDMAVPK